VLAVAIPVGLLIGLSLGALGGGGSILTVPALVYLLGQSPHAATSGSLLIVGVTALAGTAAHWRAGRVRVGQGLAFGLLGVVGSYVGSRLSASVAPDTLLAGFSALMLVAATAMARRDRKGTATPTPGPVSKAPALAARTGPGRSTAAVLDRAPAGTCGLPGAGPAFDPCRGVRIAAVATLVGLLTGFFGVGGGFVVVPALVLVLGFEMPVAVGTSLLVIALNSGVALLARLGSSTHLDGPLLATFTVAAIAGSFAGNRIASKVDPVRLMRSFTALLVVVAVYTAARSIPHLL
jgi:uncharacterized membrane protein YfcA